MSFILDALKKSESERQRQSTPGFAEVPTRVESRRPPAWLWIVAILLLVNVAALLGLYFRPAAPVPAVSPLQNATASKIETPSAKAAPQVTGVQREEVRTLSSEAAQPQPAAASKTNRAGSVTVATTTDSSASNSADGYSSYPSFSTLVANGSLQLADLHIDIHVYSSIPAERFVFINMNKYREGDKLSEGPQLKTITSDGAVLDYLGKRFILNRE